MLVGHCYYFFGSILGGIHLLNVLFEWGICVDNMVVSYNFVNFSHLYVYN